MVIFFVGTCACQIGDNAFMFSRETGTIGGKWYLSINEPATCSGSINDYDVSFFDDAISSGTYNVTLSVWKAINSTTYEKVNLS